MGRWPRRRWSCGGHGSLAWVSCGFAPAGRGWWAGWLCVGAHVDSGCMVVRGRCAESQPPSIPHPLASSSIRGDPTVRVALRVWVWTCEWVPCGGACAELASAGGEHASPAPCRWTQMAGHGVSGLVAGRRRLSSCWRWWLGLPTCAVVLVGSGDDRGGGQGHGGCGRGRVVEVIVVVDLGWRRR